MLPKLTGRCAALGRHTVVKPSKARIACRFIAIGAAERSILSKDAPASNHDRESPLLLSKSEVDTYNSLASRLRELLKTGSVTEVWKLWSELERRNMLQYLGPSQLDAFAGSLTKIIRDGDLSPAERQSAEDLAVILAQRGSPAGLEACMPFHITRRSYDRLLELFQIYANYCAKRDAVAVEVEEPREQVLEEDEVEEDEEHLPLNSPAFSARGRLDIRILLFAITCHAAKQDFASVAKLSLQWMVRLHYFTVQEFMDELKALDKDLLVKATSFMSRFRVARGLQNARVFRKQVQIASKTGGTKHLQNLYGSLHMGMSSQDAWLAPSPAQMSDKLPIAMHEHAWSAIIAAFVECGDKDMGVRVWKDMVNHGVTPGSATWSSLIQACAKVGDIERAAAAFGAMRTHNIEPDSHAYRALIEGLFAADRPEDALVYFEDARRWLKERSDGRHEDATFIYSAVIKGLLEIKSREPEARALLDVLRGAEAKPNIAVYNTFLAHYSHRRDLQALATILDLISADGVAGDVFTYSTILAALLRAGRTDAPDVVLKLMAKQNVKGNVAIYTSIIESLVREENERHLRAAMRILTWMEQSVSEDVQPNLVTYTGILTALHRRKWREQQLVDQCRQHIMRRMEERNMQMDRATYNMLIKACLENHTSHSAQQALWYFRDMERRGVVPSQDTWYLILSGLLKNGEIMTADQLAEDMIKRKFTMVARTQKLVALIRREAVMRRTREG